MTINIGNLIRSPMRKAGLKQPPYIWRSYFATHAMMAEPKGLLRDYRQFFMGHKGDIEHVYTLHKTVPPDTVEAMRKGYSAALEFLETAPHVHKGDPALRLLSYVLKASGCDSKEIEAMMTEEKSEEEIAEIIAPYIQKTKGNNKEQKVVPLSDLSRMLGNGWEYRATLPDGNAVIEHVGIISAGHKSQP